MELHSSILGVRNSLLVRFSLCMMQSEVLVFVTGTVETNPYLATS